MIEVEQIMNKSAINPLPPNFAKYINLVSDIELEQAFDGSVRQLNELDKNLLNNLADKRYADGKWTVKEILQHLADSDRIMSYQALLLWVQDSPVERAELREVAVRLDAEEATLVSRVQDVDAALLRAESHFALDLGVITLFNQEIKSV